MTNEKNIANPFVSAKVFSNINKTAAKNWTIWHIGAGIGLLGGLLILFGTAFVIIFEYFAGEKPVGEWLFLMVIPMWISGAHCFDKLEDLEKEARAEIR
jgi:hypothetical protein